MTKKQKVQKPTKAKLLGDNLVKTKPKDLLTVSELISSLSVFPSETKVLFSGLDFHRLKLRGDFCQVEFNQLIYRDEHGQLVVQEFPGE